MKIAVRLGTIATIKCPVIRDGVKIVPASGTVKIYSPEGSVIISDTVDIDNGIASVTIEALYTDKLGEDYRAEFTLSIDSVDEVIDIMFDVVRRTIHPLVTFDDLAGEYPMLHRESYGLTGKIATCTIGTSPVVTTVTDDESFTGSESENQYIGWVFEVMTGAHAGWRSSITSFTPSTGTIVLAKSPSTAFTAGDTYRLQNRYAAEISRCFEFICDYIRARGNRVNLIIDSNDLKEAHIKGTLALILFAQNRMEQFGIIDGMFKGMLGAMTFRYDSDGTGIPSNATAAAAMRSTRRSR